MSNTLKLGNGKWATGKDTLLSFSDTNNNYKPLPFSFSRASSGTVINKDGLIETVGSGEPRIDFKDDAKGSLLLEPSRTNINTNSESFNTYSLVGGSVISDNLISPSGFLNADSFVEDSNNSQHRIRKDIAVTAGNYTVSCFVKGTDRYLSIYPQSAGVAYSVFDLNNGTITKTGGSSYIDSKIENYGNGWYRCILTYSVSTGNSYVHLYLSNISSGTAAEAPTYTGNGSIMNFYGLQLEAGSYATSYIPTNGSAVTRVGDACNNGGNEQVFNDNEGVLMVEMSAIADDLTNRRITISDNSTNNRVVLGFSDASNSILALVGSSGTQFIATIAISDIKLNNKFALKYKENDFALWVNGIEIATDTSGNTPVGLSTLKIQGSTGFSNFYGNVKDVRVYNTALTNAELQALTTI